MHPPWSQERLFPARATQCNNPGVAITLQASSRCHQAPHLPNLGTRVEDLRHPATLREATLVPVSIPALVNQATPLASTRAPDKVSLVTLLVSTQAQDMDNPGIPPDAIPHLAQASLATLTLPLASIQDKADRAIPLASTRDKVIQAVSIRVITQAATIQVSNTQAAEAATTQSTIPLHRRNQVACWDSSWVAAGAMEASEASEAGRKGTCLRPRIRSMAGFQWQQRTDSRIHSRRKASNRKMWPRSWELCSSTKHSVRVEGVGSPTFPEGTLVRATTMAGHATTTALTAGTTVLTAATTVLTAATTRLRSSTRLRSPTRLLRRFWQTAST